MKYIHIKAELLDPTAVVRDCDAMSLEKIENYPARIFLTIGEYVWMVTEDGKTMRRITPKED